MLIRGGRQQSSALPGRVATIPMTLHGMIFGLLRRAMRLCAFAAVVIGVAIAVAVAAPAPKAPDGSFQTAAPYAILIEADSGSVLFEKAADELVAPSSLSKLMTAEFVLNEIQEGRLKLSDEFIVSVNAWRTGGAPSHTSSMFIPVHSKVTVDDLLHGVIIQSANDACIVLAEAIAGSENEFAERLTQRAR